jgi:hypothetical protein
MTDDRPLRVFFGSAVGHRASALKPDSISGPMNQTDRIQREFNQGGRGHTKENEKEKIQRTKPRGPGSD